MGPFLPPTGGIAQRMFAGRRPASSNEAYWRAKLANQGKIQKDNAPLVQKLQGKVASGLRAAGMDKHNASRLASKTLRALNDLTPVGNATMASDGAQQARRGYQRGSVWDAVAGGAQVGLAALPGAVSRPAKGLFGKGVKVWHGSPRAMEIEQLRPSSGGELGRGVYFSLDRDTAAGYAIPSGEDAITPHMGLLNLDLGDMKIAEIKRAEWLAERSRIMGELRAANNGEWRGEFYDQGIRGVEDHYKQQGYQGIYDDWRQGVVFPDYADRIKIIGKERR